MRELDDTDMEILRMLVEDARRPYSEIADAVDLSPPTVSDRVARLEEVGVIRRFTVDVDRSTLQSGVPVLVDVDLAPGTAGDARSALAARDGVEHVFGTADGHVVFQARVQGGEVESLLADTVPLDDVRSYEVTLLTDVEWIPQVGGSAFALECAECGNTVTAEGESSRLDGDLYHFCCSSCQARFEDRYEELRAGAEA